MNIAIYDPVIGAHEYLTKMYFNPMFGYYLDYGHSGTRLGSISHNESSLGEIKDSIVLINADHLNLHTVNLLKNNNCKIVGFSVTDSSYISQSCREAAVLSKIDLMFMLTGIQKVNTGCEMIVDKDFKIRLEERQFLPEEDWKAFNLMRISGRLQSLPYVHWERQPEIPAQPYSARSQKAIIRGGHHMRRFILALQLMQHDLLDCNSGFVTEPYFRDDMNPQFRYCEECRLRWKKLGRYSYLHGHFAIHCENPMFRDNLDLSDLGAWNNRCPQSFFAAAANLMPDCSWEGVENLLNARWLTAKEHLEMLARITFTSDLKWLFSIYAAQRFWDAAMVGCVNILPSRTNDQTFFPDIHPGEHYLTFTEDMANLPAEFTIDEKNYDEIAAFTKALYEKWLKPTDYSISTNLLTHIFEQIEKVL